MMRVLGDVFRAVLLGEEIVEEEERSGARRRSGGLQSMSRRFQPKAPDGTPNSRAHLEAFGFLEHRFRAQPLRYSVV
jgi:hypothetical protein